MANTTEADIQAIMDISDEVTDLTPFITAANQMVEKHCTDISDASAAVVETWLAAHLITIRDMRVDQEKAGSVSQSYQYKLDLGLQCSMYGQMAIQLDPTGGLADWNEKVISGNASTSATVVWLGTE